MASATTPEQAKSAIEAVALPVSSYHMKKSRNLFVLNSYLGASVAKEWIENFNTKGKPSLGAYASIGFGHNIKRFSIYLQLIDLGSVLNYRLRDSKIDSLEVSKDPEIGFDQVFSPGLYAVLSWYKYFVVSGGITVITISTGIVKKQRSRID